MCVNYTFQDDFLQQLRLKREQVRLDTFNDWPGTLPIQPSDLARDGFFNLKKGDRVKCIFCNLVLKGWEPGDVVRAEHIKFNSCCPFLLHKNVGNMPIQTSQPGTSSGVGATRLVPRFPEYSKPAAREGSFRNRPQSITQSVDELVEAGFFYTGILSRCLLFMKIERNFLTLPFKTFCPLAPALLPF